MKRNATVKLTDLDTHGLKQFTEAYLEAMHFTDLDNPDKPEFEGKKLSDELKKQVGEDCRRFWHRVYELIKGYPVQAGHDFWLTRNGYGVGFWDRPEIWGREGAKTLTDACGWRTDFPETDLYVGDDGRIYAS